MATSDSRDPIAAYAESKSAAASAICNKLQAEIDQALPKATSKIWHGGPVWFVGENPVVGYDARQNRVDLLFWSGQLFDEPALKPMGKDKAAKISFEAESDVNLADLRRWLKKSRTTIFDYAAFYAQKRAATKKKFPKRA